MHEYKAGKLHSGSPTGKLVTKHAQAVAIALRSAGMPKRKKGTKKPSRPRPSY